MTRVLLLETRDPEERRAALLEDGSLSLLWMEREEDRTLVGNVYLARVLRVEPSIGAAFVDLGLDRPGFLPADDAVMRRPADDAGFGGPADEPLESTPVPGEPAADGGADEHAAGAPVVEEPALPRIDELFRTGDAVVVQVARDAVARKGPTVTARVGFAGRTVVLMPGLGRNGVSRRIEDPARRQAIEACLARIQAPLGAGFVARTASAVAPDDEVAAEAARLVAAHARVQDLAATATAPALLHAEDDFVTRAVRELAVRTPEGAAGPLRIVCDDPADADRVRELTQRIAPVPEVALHATDVPLFHSFGVERAVRSLEDARVPLPGGASIVIHETEAMWSIDVNSGRMRTGEGLEETALATDLLAAREVARQIRLRDLSGLVVVDFIDCRDPENRRRVEEALRTELARDPAKMRVAPLSEFMVAEITRRRIRSGHARSGSHTCTACGGRGRVRSPKAVAHAALRDVRALLAEGAPRGIEIAAPPPVAAELERRRPQIAALESARGATISVVVAPHLPADRCEPRRR